MIEACCRNLQFNSSLQLISKFTSNKIAVFVYIQLILNKVINFPIGIFINLYIAIGIQSMKKVR